jgi:antirestriction protein
MKNYSIPDIAATFSVSERTAQRWVESLVIKEGNKILIPEDIFYLLKSRHAPDMLPTTDDSDIKDFERVEYFTEEEYQEFHRRLSEYPFLLDKIKYLLDDLDYHRRSVEKHQEQQKILIESITQRNFIEAKEKGFDNK